VVLGGPLLRHCATIRKVACLISTGIFHWLTPSGRTTAQRSTQRLREMSARGTSWG
jgi:hypothetical protein